MPQLTRTEIQRIHTEGLAIKDKIYLGEDGYSYLGTSAKRLRILTEAELSVFNSTSRIPSDNVQGAVVGIEERLNDLENKHDKDIKEINKAIVETKCLAIAMAAAL